MGDWLIKLIARRHLLMNQSPEVFLIPIQVYSKCLLYICSIISKHHSLTPLKTHRWSLSPSSPCITQQLWIYLTAPTANYISILDKRSLTEHFGSTWRVKQQLTDTGNIWSNTSGTPDWFNKALRHTRGYLPSLWYRGTDAHGSNLLMLLSSCLLVIPRKTGKKHHERDLF